MWAGQMCGLDARGAPASSASRRGREEGGGRGAARMDGRPGESGGAALEASRGRRGIRLNKILCPFYCIIL